jgi:hypothetical protein
MIVDPDDPRALLGALEPPPPPPDLVPRVLAAATPLLAAQARRASLRSVVRPLLVALLPLPLLVAANVLVAGALYAVLSFLLPAALSTYLVVQYALFALLSLALAYAAVPILVDRQARASFEEAHV